MLYVKIPGVSGEPVVRDEIATLYASDMLYNPYHRQAVVQPDGVVEVTAPEWPVMLHAKITVPGYGYMWFLADNCGQGYTKGAHLDFIKEAAASRIYETEKYIARGGFTPSPKCMSMLADAKAMYALAEKGDGKSALYIHEQQKIRAPQVRYHTEINPRRWQPCLEPACGSQPNPP